NALRAGDTESVRAIGAWDPHAEPVQEASFAPSRVLLQDFTGVPAVVAPGAIREAAAALGGAPEEIHPLIPADLVIDHSVQVDESGSAHAFADKVAFEGERNSER